MGRPIFVWFPMLMSEILLPVLGLPEAPQNDPKMVPKIIDLGDRFFVLLEVIFGILAKRAQDGAKMAQKGAKMAPDRPKTGPRSPKIGPRWSKTGPK